MNLFSGDDAVIQERLRELCRFVRAHEHIADSHNVDFFTGDSWSRLPAHWQRQLLSLPDSSLCRLPLAAYDALSSTTGDLHQFLQSSRNLRLPTEPHWYSQNASPSTFQIPQDATSDPLQYPQNALSDPLQYPQHAPSDPLQYPQHAPSDPLQYPQHALSDPLQYPQHAPTDPLQYPQHAPSDPLRHPQHAPSDPLRHPQSGHACMPLREVGTLDHFGMTAKKSHEVKRMADMVHRLAKNRGAQQVLDLGSGRGYLSQYLAMRYSMSVVGVDAERSNTHSAVERNRKAMRALKNVFSTQKKDIIKNAPLRGREGEAQTVLDRFPDGVGAEGMGIGAEPSPVEEEETRDYEPAALQTSTHLPVNVTEATTTLEETQNQVTTFPIQYQSSIQCKQNCSPCSHEHSPDVALVGDDLLGPLRHCHDKDGFPGNGCCSLQHSTFGHEGSSLTTAAVDSNSDPHSHIASPQSHSLPAYYTPMTGFLSLEDDPESVIRLAEVQSGGIFQRDRPTVLVGLHTCGDLAATCLKFFLKARQLTALCIVGCCYHHIREEGEGRGFPLSKFMLSLDFQLGRTMRMLALQSPDRLSESEEGLGVESMFYRAVLQVILVKECHIHGDPRDYNIGKIYAKSKGFVDYIRRSLRKLELELPEDLTDERIQVYWREYQPYRRSLFAFHQMRATVAPCIEAVIVLDRLLFLRESGLVQRAECLSLFDPNISPRTFAIVAEK